MAIQAEVAHSTRSRDSTVFGRQKELLQTVRAVCQILSGVFNIFKQSSTLIRHTIFRPVEVEPTCEEGCSPDEALPAGSLPVEDGVVDDGVVSAGCLQPRGLDHKVSVLDGSRTGHCKAQNEWD